MGKQVGQTQRLGHLATEPVCRIHIRIFLRIKVEPGACLRGKLRHQDFEGRVRVDGATRR